MTERNCKTCRHFITHGIMELAYPWSEKGVCTAPLPAIIRSPVPRDCMVKEGRNCPAWLEKLEEDDDPAAAMPSSNMNTNFQSA